METKTKTNTNTKQSAAEQPDSIDQFLGQIIDAKQIAVDTPEVRQQLIKDLRARLMEQIDRAMISALSEEQLDRLNVMLAGDDVQADEIQEFFRQSGINGETIRPKAAFLDPTNTFTVPARQTACGGFDIMAHLFDMNYFVNAPKYPLQFNVVETLLKTVKTQLPIAIKEPENYEARSTMLWAASWALNSFCTSGFKTQPSLHALEQFSSSYDLTHGLGLAIIMPKWMKYLLDRDDSVADDFARFGVNVMNVDDGNDKKAVAYKTIEALQTFIKNELGLPVYLSEIGIDDSKFDEMKVKACYGKDSLPLAYRPLTQEDCLNIYKMCL